MRAMSTRRSFVMAVGGAIALTACGRATSAVRSTLGETAATSAEVAGEEGGDEPTVAFIDPAGQFSFERPQSWGRTTRDGETVRFTGRDEFISVAIVKTAASPIEYGRGDAAALAAASPGFKGGALTRVRISGRDVATVAYSWEAGPSPVTGKTVPSSANRYYIPGPAERLAVFTYSSPTRGYDPAGAVDFARTFTWLK
jgi:hypothetical protein